MSAALGASTLKALGLRSEGRRRGRIEERGDSFRVIVYAGLDPVTGKRSYLRETVKGTTKAWQRLPLAERLALLADMSSDLAGVTVDSSAGRLLADYCRGATASVSCSTPFWRPA